MRWHFSPTEPDLVEGDQATELPGQGGSNAFAGVLVARDRAVEPAPHVGVRVRTRALAPRGLVRHCTGEDLLADGTVRGKEAGFPHQLGEAQVLRHRSSTPT